MKQQTLATASGFERYTKKTRRALFLEEMEQVVPWGELCALIEPYYPKAGNGRPPVGLERMLRIYFLQQWFNLSDPAVEEALYDSVVLRNFVGIDLGREPVPDETTVCKFRHLLEEHQRGGEMLETVILHLQRQGVRITTGTIVFWNLFIGNDNDEDLDEQPGNQLAGFDVRWTWPGGRVPLALYGQFIGEDEAGYLPSKYLGLFGAETWGEAFDGTWRAHVEYADTTCNFLGTPQYGCAYESATYTDGYRYRGASMGHSVDSDGESLGIGGMLIGSDGREWQLLWRDMRLNRDGASTQDPLADGPADVWDVELTHRRPFTWGTLEASVGYSSPDPDPGVTVSVSDGWRGFVSWRHELR